MKHSTPDRHHEGAKSVGEVARQQQQQQQPVNFATAITAADTHFHRHHI